MAKKERLQIMDEIKYLDTSKCEPNPMVARLLAHYTSEFKEKVERLEGELATKSDENTALKVKVAILTERSHVDKILSGVRILIGIFLGISTSLFFSNEALLNKIGLILSLILLVLFLLTYIFRRKE